LRKQLGYLVHPVDGDPGALFHGQWVVGRLEDDVWPRTNWFGVHVCLEIERGYGVRR
jgi:hypothetical protein